MQFRFTWLDISMQKMFRVDKFYPIDHLLGQHKHGLQTEPPLVLIQELLQILPQQI